MALEGFRPIFREARVVCANADLLPSHKFLFHVKVSDPPRLRIFITDFHANSWEAVRTVDQLEDMRDSIGIGGSWSEFVDYLAASLKSEDSKLVLQGAASAKLVAQKSKGMPVISISLVKLVDCDATEAIANFSLELFKAFKDMQSSISRETEHLYEKAISIDQTKNESNKGKQHSFSRREKRQKLSVLDVADGSDSLVCSEDSSVDKLQDSPDKVTVREKVTNRVVPAYRRAKRRGAFIQDMEGDEDKDA